MREKGTGRVGLDLTEGKIFPVMVSFAVPLLLTNVIQQLYNLADMMIVGYEIGNAGTVGVSTGGIIPAFITGIGNSFGTAVQVCTAQMWGAGKKDRAGRVGMATLKLMLVLAAAAGTLCFLLAAVFVRTLNCPQEAIEQAENYMRITACGFPFIFGYNVVSGILRGMGESRKPLIFVGIAALSNVVMDLILVVIFPLEAAGSAIATVIAQAMSFFAALLYISHSELKQLISDKAVHLKTQLEYAAPVIKIAVPLALQYGCIQFSQIICNAWVNGFGMTASATTSIGNKIGQFIGVITLSVTGAAGAMIAQNLGARKYDRVKQVVYAALRLEFIICVLEYIVSIVFPEQLFSLFTKDAAVIEMGRAYLKIMLITYFLNALQGPYTAVITGCGNTKLSFVYGALDGIVLRLGIAYMLAFVYGMGVTGYWIGNALAHMGPVVIGIVYFYSGRWKQRRLVSDKEEKEDEKDDRKEEA